MRKDNLARVLRLGTEPGAVVDERPTEGFWRGFVLASALWLALGIASIVAILVLIEGRVSELERKLNPPGKVYGHE